MRHPKRAITPEIRVRRAKRSGRERDDLEAQTWPDGQLMRPRKIRHLSVLDASGRLVGKGVVDLLGEGVLSAPARWGNER